MTLFPCNDCAKALAQMRIKRVVYRDDYLRIIGSEEGEVVREKEHDGMTPNTIIKLYSNGRDLHRSFFCTKFKV